MRQLVKPAILLIRGSKNWQPSHGLNLATYHTLSPQWVTSLSLAVRRGSEEQKSEESEEK